MTGWRAADQGPATMWPLWQKYVVVEGAVLVPPAVARWLAKRVDMAALRDEARTADPEIHAALVALRAAELMPIGPQVPPEVPPQVPAGSIPSEWDPALGICAVAEVVGIGRRAVNRAVNDGRLPATRVGGKWRVRRADAEAWAERRKAV